MNQVFVYGTLKPGHHNWLHIAPYADTARQTTTTGTLYDTGYGWPAAKFGSDGNPIPGWTVTIRDYYLPVALATLDHIEGIEHGLFERITITDTNGEPCWAYQWPSEVEKFTKINEW